MQQTKIKESTEYVIENDVVRNRYPWRVRQHVPGTVTATVIEKGLKSEPWKTRADAVKVRINDDIWAAVTETIK